MDGWVDGFRNIQFFNLTEDNNKFDFYTDTFDVFSIEELRYELEKIFSVPDITPQHPQHEKIGQRNIDACKKLGLEKSTTGGHFIILMGYARSLF